MAVDSQADIGILGRFGHRAMGSGSGIGGWLSDGGEHSDLRGVEARVMSRYAVLHW